MPVMLIEDIDLEPIMVKVMDKEEGLGWSLDFTRKVAAEYRKYLILCKENPDFPMVPSVFVDDFWHFHILDTLKYQDDCEKALGYFLHHFPYFGMRNKEDANNLKKAWEESRNLYESRFGKIDEEIWPKSRRCPNCGRRCKRVDSYAVWDRPRLAI